MAHFAKIGLNNTVIEIHTVDNNIILDANGNESETNGIDFLTKLTGWAIWKQTSYNTYGGVHYGQNGQPDGKTPLRKNHAGIGYIYDETRDAFIPPQPYPSWVLNESTCNWQAPTPMPTDGQRYTWNELTLSWDIVK